MKKKPMRHMWKLTGGVVRCIRKRCGATKDVRSRLTPPCREKAVR